MSPLSVQLRSIDVGEQFLSIVSEILSDRRQRVHLDGNVRMSADMVSEVSQGSVLEPLLFILYTFELLFIAGNHIMGYADDAKMHAVTSRPSSSDTIALSGFGSSRLMGFELASEAQPNPDNAILSLEKYKVHGG